MAAPLSRSDLHTTLQAMCRNVDAFVDQDGNPTRCIYLDGRFRISKNPAQQATAQTLMASLDTYVPYARSDEKIWQQLNTIVSRLKNSTLVKSQISRDLLIQIRMTQTALDSARLKELELKLAGLIQVKELIHATCQCTELGYPAALGHRFRSANTTPILAGDKLAFLPSHSSLCLEDLQKITKTRHGSAFLARFHFLSIDKNNFTLDFSRIQKQDLEFAQKIADAFPVLQICVSLAKANHSIDSFDNSLKILGQKCPNVFNSKALLFYQTHCPSIYRFSERFSRTVLECMRSDDGSDVFDHSMEQGLAKLYAACKEYVRTQGDIDSVYSTLYADYHSLQTKEGRHVKSTRTLPTPAEFSTSRCVVDPDIPYTSLIETPTDDAKEGKEPLKAAPPTKDAVPTGSKTSVSESATRAAADAVASARTKDSDEKESLESRTVARAPSKKDSVATGSKTSVSESATRTAADAVASAPTKDSDEKESHESRTVARAPSKKDSAAAAKAVAIFTSRTFPFPELIYDNRVLLWRTNPTAALANQYPEKLPPVKQQKMAVWRHAFDLDRFLGTKYSLTSSFRNKTTGHLDTLIGIAGEVEWEGRTYSGVFQHTFDADGICYHHHFGSNGENAFLQALITKQMDRCVHFPTLEASHAIYTSKAKSHTILMPGEHPFEIDDLDIITLRQGDLSIRIFKLG